MKLQQKIKTLLHAYTAPYEHRGHKPHLFTVRSLHTLFIGLVVLQMFSMMGGTWANIETNISKQVLIDLTNQTRLENNVVTLIPDEILTRAAQARAQEMASRGYFSHVSPEGNKPWMWFDNAGYDFSYAGENLAVNFTNSEDIEKAWVNSPTHFKNLVLPQYTHIGIGIAEGLYQGNEAVFVVQFFAKPTKKQLAKIKQGLTNIETTPKNSQTQNQTMTNSSQQKVLGDSIQKTGMWFMFDNLFAGVNTLQIIILYSLLIAIILIFMVAVRMHVQPKYKEILIDTLFIVVILVFLIWYHNQNTVNPQITTDNYSAIEIRE